MKPPARGRPKTTSASFEVIPQFSPRERQAAIVAHIAAHPRATRKDMVRALGYSPGQVRADLVALRSRGEIENAPYDKGWSYTLTPQGQTSLARPTRVSAPERRAEIVAHVRAHPGLRRGEIVRALGFDLHLIRKDLSVLFAQGTLQLHGQREDARYTVPGVALPAAAYESLVGTRRDAILAYVERHGPVSANDVWEATGFERRRVKDDLVELLARGRIVMRGRRRGAFYVGVAGAAPTPEEPLPAPLPPPSEAPEPGHTVLLESTTAVAAFTMLRGMTEPDAHAVALDLAAELIDAFTGAGRRASLRTA